MSGKSTEEQTKIEENKAAGAHVEEKNVSSKKKKKATKQAAEALDDDTLRLLVDQKLKEFGVVNEDDKEVKRLRKKYAPFTKATVQTVFQGDDDATKLNKLVETYNQLLEQNSFFEEQVFILDRHQNQAKAERDFVQAELAKLANLKSNFEKFARDVQKNNNQIKDINKKFVEEETKKREEIVESFEKSLSDIAAKLEEERAAATTHREENVKLKAEFEEKIKHYEQREKEFYTDIQGLDSQSDEKRKGVMDNLKNIEEQAKKAFEIKDKIAALKRQETEEKLKIAVYSQRFGDLGSTFDNTVEVLQRFREELTKSGSRVKSLNQENQEFREKNEKMGNLTLELVYMNEDIKKQIQQKFQEKEALKAKCLSIQNDVNARTKQFQELEKQKATAV